MYIVAGIIAMICYHIGIGLTFLPEFKRYNERTTDPATGLVLFLTMFFIVFTWPKMVAGILASVNDTYEDSK